MTPTEPEGLLAHSGFIRTLARHLVRDANDADDICQQTWLAALKHPPAPDRSLRGWLSQIVRNFTFRRYNEEKSRRSREEICAISGAAPSAHDVASRDEIVRVLSEAVLGLDEPYRSTILMRYYENLPPRIIAAQTAVPIATVKTRLNRALQRLRSRLDGSLGPERKTWCLALAPLAGIKFAPVAASTATWSGPILSGGLAMSLKAKLVATGLVLFGLTLLIMEFLNPPGDVVTIEPADPAAALTITESIVATGDPDEQAEASLKTTPVTSVAKGTFLSGRVTDLVTGEPVRSFEVRLERYEIVGSEKAWYEETRKTFRGDEGRFRLDLPQGGIFLLGIYAPDHHGKSTWDFKIVDGKGISDYNVQLDSGITLTGTVVDDRTGDPVAGALVVESRKFSPMQDLVAGLTERVIHTRTDEHGRFRLSGVHEKAVLRSRQVICAWRDDYAQGFAYFDPRDPGELEIRLEKGFRITGKALDDEGEPCAGLQIRVTSDLTPAWIFTTTGPDGSYETLPLRPGFAEIRASVPPREDASAFGFSQEVVPVEIVGRDLVFDFGPKEDHVIWNGTLIGFDGEPVSDGDLSIYRDFNDPRCLPGSQFSNSFDARSAEDGRFEVRKLLPGTYEVAVRLGRSFEADYEETILFEEPGRIIRDVRMAEEEAVVEDTLAFAGAIGGTVLLAETGRPLPGERRANIALQRANVSGSLRYGKILDGARFRFENLGPGIYDITLLVQDCPKTELKGIRLFKGQKRDDVEVVVPVGGKLRMELTGFTDSDSPSFRLRRYRAGSAEAGESACKLELDGSYGSTRILETGDWIVSVTFEELGFAKKRATVVAGETAHVTIDRSELVPVPGAGKAAATVSFAGSLTRPDGRPLPGWPVRFYHHMADGLPGGRPFATTETDENGLFSVPGFAPGWWKIDITNPGDDRSIWSRIARIDKKLLDPHTVRLVVPDGKITGTLCSSLTGQPLCPKLPEVSIYVRESGTNNLYSGNRCELRNGMFQVAGLPKNGFHLEITAPGFRRLETQKFFPRDGESFDVGKVMLEPEGIVKLRVAGPDRKPFPPYKAYFFWNGNLVFYRKTIPASDGFRYYVDRRTGKIPVEIRALGFMPWKGNVVLEPGRPFELDVVLKPRQ